MYARYIPGAKPQGSSPPPSPPKASSPAPAAAQITSTGFSTYARYIPGAKPVQKQQPVVPVEPSVVRFDDDDDKQESPAAKRKRDVEEPVQPDKKSKKTKDMVMNVAEVEAESQDDDEGTKKSKKSKKEKKNKQKKDRKDKQGSEDDAVMIDADDRMETDEEEEDLANDKKKKIKKIKKLEEDPSSDEDDNDDDSESEDNNNKDSRHKVLQERMAKSLKIAAKASQNKSQTTPSPSPEPLQVHELGPLPQPAPAPFQAPNLTYETLPSWLAAPIRVSQDTRTPFSDLGIIPKAARTLQGKGFPDAFAVQTAALPLLLPSSNKAQQQPGDLLISAATGSGKTLAYALPIVKDISQTVVTRLRALVVLPTRELVKQAQEVFELCAKAYEGSDRKRVRVGVAIGSQTLKAEQEYLVDSESRYDPATYKAIREERRKLAANSSDDDIYNDDDATFENPDPRLGQWDGEVIDFLSKVDVLICTPGRLVEHLEQTPGFSLDFIRWLVVDEADKLLAQSFQGWLDVVLEHFKTSKFTAREFPDATTEIIDGGVRKVILSATLTRDLSLLNQLGLQRPQLIILESKDGDGHLQVAEHSLPALLEEFAIRVHNVNLKPLYLLDLLRSEHMAGSASTSDVKDHDNDVDMNTEDKSVSSQSESDSDSDTSDSDTSDDDTSDSDSDSDATSETSSSSSSSSSSSPTHPLPTALIFTKSNESALRLSRLLSILSPQTSHHITTLTSTTPTHIRRKILRSFTTPSSPVRLIIASDLVARGIDIPALDHVINYDLPPSVASYVHRVGRTARAGRSGRAWTLVGDDESGWFWGKIAKSKGVRRAKKVDRCRIEEITDEARVESYEAALEKLGQEALDAKRR